MFVGVIFLLTGCERKSVENIYDSTTENSTDGEKITSENSSKSNVVTGLNQYHEINNDVNMILYANVALAENRENRFEISVEDVVIGDYFSDLQSMTSTERYELLYKFLTEYDNNGFIQSDGTISKDRYGIDRCALFVKVHVKNTGSSVASIGMNNLRLYNMKQENGKWYYQQVPVECRGIDAIQKYDSSFCNIELLPQEETDVVLFFPMGKELVTQYERDENGDYVNIKTDGTALKDLYMNTNLKGTEPLFPNGVNILKLNVENGQVVK